LRLLSGWGTFEAILYVFEKTKRTAFTSGDIDAKIDAKRLNSTTQFQWHFAILC